MEASKFFTQALFAGTESLAIFLMLTKVVGSLAFYKQKHHVVLNKSFWFYLFFIITYACVIGFHWLNIFLEKNPLQFPDLDFAFVSFARAIFLNSSFLYLQVYCYKVVTTKSNVDLYSGNIYKKTKNIKLQEKSTHFFITLNGLLQSLVIGIYPLFRENPKLSVEYLSALIVFVAFLHIVILYTSTDNCKKILAPWIFFAFIVFLMVSLSALVNRIMFFDILFATKMIFRSIFLSTRVLQVLVLFVCALRFSDVRLLYD